MVSRLDQIVANLDGVEPLHCVEHSVLVGAVEALRRIAAMGHADTCDAVRLDDSRYPCTCHVGIAKEALGE